MRRRVVITGMGVVSPIGSGLNKFRKALQEGVSGANRITAFDTTDFAVKIAGEVKDLNPDDFFPGTAANKMDRFTKWGVIAADEAMGDA
ncbi:MAG: beta-ketoacyl-[acyl-carrier-protein] synthase II, partial [Candidatus Marinimicrobia bacterium]|nr:beta-ketoacyl-[acyl-carrier-protein] synthase II [Candidatus Neomarinimicrobiota bacterium]